MKAFSPLVCRPRHLGLPFIFPESPFRFLLLFLPKSREGLIPFLSSYGLTLPAFTEVFQ